MTELPIDLTGLDDDMLDQLVVAAHAETHRRAVYRVLQAHTSAAHWPPDAAHSLYVRE